MHITVITQYYKPETGAPQNRLLEMCLGLKKQGAAVSVVTAMPNYPTGKIFDGYKNRFHCREIIDDMEVLRYWLYPSNSRKLMPRIWSMISFSITVLCSLRYLCKRKNDYIIVNSPPLTLAFSAWILARLSGSRLIMNIADLWPLSAKELGAIREKSLMYKMIAVLERFLYRHSDICFGQSQEIVDYVASHGAKETYLFRNGVDPKRFENISSSAPKDGTLRIIYTGLLGYAQGVLNICKQVDFKNLHSEFHIYGAGGEQKEIEQYIAAHPDKGIIYHGKVAREQIPEILSHYDCTLIPLVSHIYGAVPSKIYESMAAGLPILFSGGGEGARIIEENQLGWVSASADYEALSENIRLVHANPKEYETYKANGIRCAQTKFNRPQQTIRLYQYLEEFINRQKHN